MWDQGRRGTGRELSNPTEGLLEFLLLAQVGQAETYSWVSRIIAGHQNFAEPNQGIEWRQDGRRGQINEPIWMMTGLNSGVMNNLLVGQVSGMTAWFRACLTCSSISHCTAHRQEWGNMGSWFFRRGIWTVNLGQRIWFGII